jgi:hypothetical protein
MKLIAVLTLACGLAAAPLVAAGGASADPATCDGAACALFVKKNIVPTDPCQFQSRNPFGLDAKGSTFACTASNEWVPVAPLLGCARCVRPVTRTCPVSRCLPRGRR